MNTLINLFKIYLGFFVENTVFSSLIYGLIFNLPIAIYYSITSYLNILFWARLKSFICSISFLETLRPQTTLFIETKFGDVLFKLGKYGMPSFHSNIQATCLCFGHIILKKKESKIKILNLFLLYILVVFSRIYFNVHTLGQVIVGSFLGFLSGKISFYIYNRFFIN